MDNPDLFKFSDENFIEKSIYPDMILPSWKVLSVEDDKAYQASLSYSLSDLNVLQRPIEVLMASSALSAAEILAYHHDISVILLDVVMESDDAGLRLIDTIREVLGNSMVRIILLTGQPGMAPCDDVMQRYDIDEYWSKSDLTSDKLQTIVTSHIRTWHSMFELHQARKGLQMVIDASRAITNKQNIKEFSQIVLQEIGRFIGVPSEGGIFCAKKHLHSESLSAQIITAVGVYDKGYKTISDLLRYIDQTKAEQIRVALQTVTLTGQHLFSRYFNVLCFDDTEISQTRYLMIVDSEYSLSENHLYLLQIFSENIRSGFTNISLMGRLSELAYQDNALKMYNRNWLLRELNAMGRHERLTSMLLMVDVNNFNLMQITFGSEHATELLKLLSQNLLNTCPSSYAIACVDDHSLALLMPYQSMDDEHLSTLLAEQCLCIDELDHYIQLTVARVDLSLLVEEPAERILQLAETVIFQARQRQLKVMSYEPSVLSDVTARYQLLRALHYAVWHNELFLMLQPKIELASRKVVGFEALLRWRREDGTLVPPDKFIPIAEASGLITHIDTDVLRMTISVLNVLEQAGYKLPVSFNATCDDLGNEMYVNTLFSAIEQGKVDPTLLDLEITESQAMEDYESLAPLLKRILATGMGVSIDDFGTGYSSLAHITKLSATTLKVDRAFVSAMSDFGDDGKSGEHVVEMVIRLGQRFNFSIIAEGIETEMECAQLLAKGCTLGQGYLFAKPMPIEEVLNWLKGQSIGEH